jgi:hypothetical protein
LSLLAILQKPKKKYDIFVVPNQTKQDWRGKCFESVRNRFSKWLSHGSGRQPDTYVKPEAAITVFELLTMGVVSPKTFKKH